MLPPHHKAARKIALEGHMGALRAALGDNPNEAALNVLEAIFNAAWDDCYSYERTIARKVAA